MTAYRGADGEVLWKKRDDESYHGPCMLHHDTVIVQGSGFDLLTGRPRLRTNALTGREVRWTFTQNHCGYAVAGEYLLTLRSEAAGFFDLERDGGTGHFGGFRSGCSANLIPACGVLNAPDYTRACSCSYQNQCSLALVHMPGVEVWTENPYTRGAGRIRRLGVNLAAPGDRRTDGGTLWLDYPSVGGRSPAVKVDIDGTPEYFRRHSSVLADKELPWVAASGCKGLTAVSITLVEEPAGDDAQSYTVRLHFAEPDDVKPGERVFDVQLQGKTVHAAFDVVGTAGRPLVPVVLTFRNVSVRKALKVQFVGKTRLAPVISGVELVLEQK